MGRPTKYNDKIAAAILRDRANGLSVRKICAQPGMPVASTVHKWIREVPEFSQHYAEACEIDADIEFETLNDMADAATPTDVQVVKLRIDTRKWVLSKRIPKKYGEKLELDGTVGGVFQITLDKEFKGV